MKIIRFDCETRDEQTELIENTFFEIVGPYLVYKSKESYKIQVIKLPIAKDKILSDETKIGDSSTWKQRRESVLNELHKEEDWFINLHPDQHHVIDALKAA